VLNPDPTAPDPTAPDPTAPDPTAIELYTVDLAAPDPTAIGVDVTRLGVLAPDPTAPDPTAVVLEFPDPTAPDPTAPDPTAPDPTARQVLNPDVTAPDPTAPDPTANALTDTVYRLTNTGDSAAAYKVKLLFRRPLPRGFRAQVILNTLYELPAAKGCDPGVALAPTVVSSIPEAQFVTTTTDLANPDPTATAAADASIALEAGQTGFIVVRLFDPNRHDNVTVVDPVTGITTSIDPQFSPAEEVEVAVVPPVDNVEVAKGVTETKVRTTFLFITTGALPTASTGSPYRALLAATGNVGAVTWSLSEGSLPPGLVLDPATGQIGGAATSAGTFSFTVQAADSIETTGRTLSVTVVQTGLASLAFAQPPTDSFSGERITPAVTVRAIDAEAAAVPGVTVQVAIGNNPGGGTLSGTTSKVTGADGVAVFTDLSIDAPGLGYTLVATAAGFATDTSVGFAINPRLPPSPATFTVSNTADSGPGSLRQALLDANANFPASDTIVFNLPGPGPHTITPLSPLPLIQDGLLVDAAPAGDCDGHPPVVEIDGVSAGLSHGLVVNSPGVIVRGLSVTRFGFSGIFLAGGAGTRVECSYLGVAPDGVTVKGNQDGVRISGSRDNVIGGLTPDLRNVISGNTANGITIFGPTANNNVQGNHIGTDVSGLLDRGNSGNGVHLIDAEANVIGGATDAARNVISGNGGFGVRVDGAGSNRIDNNYLGTSASGLADLGNGQGGVYLRRSATNVLNLNVISGNDGDASAGVWICGDPSPCPDGDFGTEARLASGNALFNNLVGSTFDQSGAVGNTGAGVKLDEALGTLLTGNVITANGRSGVVILGDTSFSNRLQSNRIHSNTELGIDLGGDGVTPNDVGSSGLPPDTDPGPNGRQNFPVIASATRLLGVTSVEGSLQSAPNTPFTIELFLNAACDASGNGEGQNPVESQLVTTDLNGDASFTIVTGAGPVGFISATATSGVDGSTSEFSNCVPIVRQPQTFTVTNVEDAGPGSLRQAILDANANAGPRDTIGFAIPGAPPHTIVPQSPLPAVTDPVIIDGRSPGPCTAAPPFIEIDGVDAGAAFAAGLTIVAGDSIVRGVAITRFSGSGIELTGSGSRIECTYLGVAPDGATPKGNANGVVIRGLLGGATNNIVGGSTTAVRNVVSANLGSGVTIIDTTATGNFVEGNHIGTDAAGTVALGNGYGVLVSDSAGNVIGSSAAGGGNLISGNANTGIYISGSSSIGNVVWGNRIGTDVSGTSELGNGRHGIEISHAPTNRVGGTTVEQRNVISGNGQDGIHVGVGAGNVIVGNFIGTTVSGTAALPNNSGIAVMAPDTVIGGTSPGAANLISGNSAYGVWIGGSVATGNRIQGNLLGTDVTGTLALGNGIDGVRIQERGNHVGGTSVAARNVISGNGASGVAILGGSELGGAVDNNFVQGNYIGTNAAGTGALGNGSDGVFLSEPNNLVGGPQPGARNVISANLGSGVRIVGAGGNVVQHNFIGTDASGSSAAGNAGSGVVIQNAPDTVVGTVGGGGSAPNVISGNFHGVEITGLGTTFSQVQGNYVGTNAAGTAAIPNVQAGVVVSSGALGTSVGGNVISANGSHGVWVVQAPQTFVGGNLIGTKVNAAEALGNGGNGIQVTNSSVRIGDTFAGARNVIAASGQNGIRIDGGASAGSVVRGNFIGTNDGGADPLGNSLAGVSVEFGASVSIGGTDGETAINTIAFNAEAGVRIAAGAGNGTSLRFNRFYSNGGLGIDLGADSVTPNDLGDGDPGPNDLQNFPVLGSATGGSISVVDGALNSKANTQFTIDFFVSPTCDPSGHGEGETWFGSTTGTTDTTGNLSFSAEFGLSLSDGSFVTAIATSPSGDSSEFSACVVVGM
jgi:hypothetical protein